MRVAAVALLVALVVATGCVHVNTRDNAMRAWTGQHADKLIQAWGAPDSESTLSDGRRFLTWVSHWTAGSPSTASGTDESTSGTCRKSVTVNQDGIIEQWSHSGCKWPIVAWVD